MAWNKEHIKINYIDGGCDCSVCVRGRKYYDIIGKLNDEDGFFMHELYEYMLCLEEDNAVYEYSSRNKSL